MATELVLAQAVLVIVVAILGARVARRFNFPDVLVLLFAGYVLGPDVLGILVPAEVGVTLEALAFLAITVILFVDGLRADARAVLRDWKTVLSVATVAVFVVVVGLGAFLHYVLGFGWLVAFLLASVVASTDPASIFPMLRRVNVPKKLSSLIEAETAFNDAAALALFSILLAAYAGGDLSLHAGVSSLVWFLVSSTAVGVGVGFLAVAVFRRLGVSKDLLLASVAVLLAAYAVGQGAGASGVIAVVVAAFVFGGYVRSNRVESLHRLYVVNAWEDLNFLATALVFVGLGAYLELAVLLPYALLGLAIALAILFVVRPLAISISTFFDSTLSLREKLFVSWIGGPRGAVSAALAALLVAESSRGTIPAGEADAIFSVTLVVIVVSIVLVVASGPFAARRLLGRREDPVGFEHQTLSAELRAMRVAHAKLSDDFKRGLLSPRNYRELRQQHARLLRRVELRLSRLLASHPRLELRQRAASARDLVATHVDEVERAFENKELTEDARNALLEKYNNLMSKIDELEGRLR